jgi:5-methylcytosine-specific restriction protein B
VTDVQVGTFGRVAATAVEAVGRRLIEAGLGSDDSLLTPGEPIWTLNHLDELKRDYVDKPDTGSGRFFEKLNRQLAGASPAVIQLFAELLASTCFPSSTSVGNSK